MYCYINDLRLTPGAKCINSDLNIAAQYGNGEMRYGWDCERIKKMVPGRCPAI